VGGKGCVIAEERERERVQKKKEEMISEWKRVKEKGTRGWGTIPGSNKRSCWR